MIEWLKFRRELAGLQRQELGLRKNYTKILTEAKKNNTPPRKIESIEREEADRVSDLHEEMDSAVTWYLMARARRARVPTPALNDNEAWTHRRGLPEYPILTPKGVHDLRAASRQEWREKTTWFVPLLTTVTGLVGALTGLLSVWKR